MVKIETKIFSFSIFFLLFHIFSPFPYFFFFSIFFLLFRNPFSLIVQSHGHILLNQTFPQILKTESSKAGLRGPGKVRWMFPRIQIAQNVFLKSVLLSFNKAIAPARPSLHYLLLKALIGIYQDRLSRKCFARLLKQFFSTSQLFYEFADFKQIWKAGWLEKESVGADAKTTAPLNHVGYLTTTIATSPL